MKKPAVWIVVIFALAFLLMMYSSTRGLSQYRVEVCVAFGGATECRTASGATRQAAERAAHDNACAMLASGVTDSIACQNTPATKVTWLDSK